MKSYHMHSIPMHLITGTLTGLLSSSLFISAIMSSKTSTDQAIKALQAQNAQFQEMFMNLAKGQKDLKTLILKDKKKKKKKKKKTALLNMGHRFGNRLRDEVDLSYSSGGGRTKKKGGLLALLFLTMRLTLTKTSILRLRTSISNLKTG